METYSPVIIWFYIRLLLILSVIKLWYTWQVNFVLAYPHAPIEHNLHKNLPNGIETKKGNGKTHVLIFINNLYSQKQAGQVWNKYLTNEILTIGFEQSAIAKCILYWVNIIFAWYVSGGIFAGPCKSKIDQVIKGIQATGLYTKDKGYI